MSGNHNLPNGLILPEPWPPDRRTLSLEPELPPYLTAPPEVIPIDVGRQLFVDDFLIERTTLRRSFHLAQYHPQCPVLRADRPWEHLQDGPRQGPFAAPFSDGIWFDPTDGLFKMWYFADYGRRHLCHAVSPDGVHWDKPALDVVPGTNIVLSKPGDARVVWLDQETADPARRFALVTTHDGQDLIAPEDEWYGSRCAMEVHFSPDGVHWSDSVVRTGPTGDRNSAFYNPFRGLWVYSLRGCWKIGGLDLPQRCRCYWESPDLVSGVNWGVAEPPLWVGADNLDLRREPHNIQPELYTLDVVAYESLMVGLFCILRAHGDPEIKRPKINEICLGFSRDGFHWWRPDRRPFCPVSEEVRAWNWGNIQSAGGSCLVVGDQLYFYVSGRAGTPGNGDADGSTGLALLRRDGFASLDADAAEGSLTTRPVRFNGRYLFVNLDAADGRLEAEVLDRAGQVIEPFTRANCHPVSGDQTRAAVTWQGADDLSALRDRDVRFAFHLHQGRLYAFWVSPDPSGASHGYVAAGGPGFAGPTDTVGGSQAPGLQPTGRSAS